MNLITFRVRNFRNYTRAELPLHPGVNLLWGPNGSGKTNLLEAIAYCAYPRSFRGVADAHLVHWGAEEFLLGAEIRGPGGEHRLQIRYTRGNKDARLDGKRVEAYLRLFWVFPVLVYEPRLMDLVLGGQPVRRRWFDRMFALLDATYLDALMAYRRALRERNRLLRAGRRDSPEEQAVRRILERRAEQVQAKRTQMLQELNRFFVRRSAFLLHQEGSVQYHPRRRRFEEIAHEEARFGYTRTGPHLDRYTLVIGKRDPRQSASLSEIRILLMALLLAISDVYRERYETRPLLLVDELPGLLTRDRLENLLGALNGMQVILTHHMPIVHAGVNNIPVEELHEVAASDPAVARPTSGS